jgi:hypothetical protein
MNVVRAVSEMTDDEILVEHEWIDFDAEDGSRSDQLFSEMEARGLTF